MAEKMKQEAWTPGPWEVWGGNRIVKVVKNDAGVSRFQIAEAPGRTPEEGQANARLIAAAPMMLEALKKICERWTFDNNQQHTHTWHDWADCIPDARAALAKAQGRAT